MKFLAKLLRRSKVPGAQARDPVRYEREKAIARGQDVKARLALARDPRTHQEILFYLGSHDPDAGVRQAVARNAATPVQTGVVLAIDKDVDVRMALAERLLALLPDLDRGRQSQLYAFAVQALGTLALDEVLKIRKALASTLKDYAKAPPSVVTQLAKDIEQEVAEPILRYCVALDDAALLEILKNHPAGWAVEAIAGRKIVSSAVSSAVIAHEHNRKAGVVLIGNKGAELNEGLLETIVEKARHYPEWQRPLAVEARLPAAMALTLAAYAHASVRELLEQRSDFDPQTKAEIVAVFHRRLDSGAGVAEAPEVRAARLEKEGLLNEAAVSDAVGMRDRAFVLAALARLAKTDVALVQKIIGLKAPKPIVALARRCGLSMRMALLLQKDVAGVAPKELIYPRGGTDYPLGDEEMAKQLDFLGLK